MKNPVLVRVRQTALDRRRFAELANVSNVAPMREMEIAKKDASNLSPELFSLFNPAEDGNIFTAGNQDFIRAFIRNVVPQSERPALIDSRGGLSQSGLRRIRNALFVSAFGDSPEAMNALGRMAEDIEADGRNITNALIASAPVFARQNAAIKDGSLHDAGITGDLVAALQALMDIRARGERVADYLGQGQLIADGVTPFQREILQFLDRNGRSAKRIFETLRRYAAALDAAGDPRQIILIQEDAPSREGLWNLAQCPPVEGPVLAAGHRAVAAPNWHRVYNRLFNMQRSGVRLNESQRSLLDRAERELGQVLMFAGDGYRPGPRGEGVAVGAFDEGQDQGRLFSGERRSPSPRILEEFSDWPFGFDEYGLPNPPRTLPDNSPLLQTTKEKKTATLRADHPLVAAGMLPANREIPRKALQRAIVAHLFRGKTPVTTGRPTAFASAGGGGAGKSSILKILNQSGVINTSNAVVVNADDIKEYLPEYELITDAGDGRAAAVTHEESSQIAKNLLDRLLDPAQPRYDFVYDATLSKDESARGQFSRWKQVGYDIHLVGVTIDPQQAMERAANRGKKSGRWVPSASLAEAHRGFNANIKSYFDAVDKVRLFDNTPPAPHEIASKTEPAGKIEVSNPELWSIVD